jgi:hypothetical protein
MGDDTMDTFVFKLTNPAKIQQMRSLIGQPKIVGGIIVTSPASYNAPWHYYLDPGTITTSDAAMEVCDASIRYVEEHLLEVGGAFLPGNRWCPWNAHIIEEIRP